MVNAVLFELPDQPSDRFPAILPHFRVLYLPVLPHLRREFRLAIEIAFAEIQQERPRHDVHLDDLQFVVGINKSRYRKLFDSCNVVCAKSLIASQLCKIGLFASKHLNRGRRSRSPDCAVLSKAERAAFVELQAASLNILFGPRE